MKQEQETDTRTCPKYWHAVQYANNWWIQDSPMYNGKNIMDADEVGEEQAKTNAELCANAPLLRDALKRLVVMAKTTGGTAGPDSGLMRAIELAEVVLLTIKPTP